MHLQYGASANHPYLALATVRQAVRDAGGAPEDEAAAEERFRSALTKGLLKILSKMGISTLRSYHGAQLFEAIGIAGEVVQRCFTGTPSSIGGVGLGHISGEVLSRHAAAFGTPGGGLEEGSLHRYRQGGEAHAFEPPVVKALHAAIRTGDRPSYEDYAGLVHRRDPIVLRDLLEFRVSSMSVPGGSIPTTLSSITGHSLADVQTIRDFSFDGMSKINGREYDMERIDFQVPFDQTELWRFHTNGNAPHPVHVHGASFQVVSRTGGRGALFPWETGWKDTVLLEDGETVERAARGDRVAQRLVDDGPRHRVGVDVAERRREPVREDDAVHRFAQFGSGTFWGVPGAVHRNRPQLLRSPRINFATASCSEPLETCEIKLFRNEANTAIGKAEIGPTVVETVIKITGLV
jgi:hypothetical protein